MCIPHSVFSPPSHACFSCYDTLSTRRRPAEDGAHQTTDIRKTRFWSTATTAAVEAVHDLPQHAYGRNITVIVGRFSKLSTRQDALCSIHVMRYDMMRHLPTATHGKKTIHEERESGWQSEKKNRLRESSPSTTLMQKATFGADRHIGHRHRRRRRRRLLAFVAAAADRSGGVPGDIVGRKQNITTDVPHVYGPAGTTV